MASGWMRVKQRAKQRGVELPLVISDRFLLSAVARTLSLRSIYAEGEQAAYRRFCALRWPETGGRPVCPACACLDVYDLRTRQRFKCAACGAQFSVTSGTIFASRKLSFTDLLAAICLFVNGAKGMSAVQLPHLLWTCSTRLPSSWLTSCAKPWRRRRATPCSLVGTLATNRDSPDDRLPSADNLPFRRSRQACEGSNRPRRPHRPAS